MFGIKRGARQRQMPLRLSILATGLIWAAVAGAEVVVIANTRGGAEALTKEQVSALFLGKMNSLPSGNSATPLDQPESSPLRDEFYSKLTGKSAAQIKAYWAKMSFTGKGIPPKEKINSADVKKSVAATPSAIGYIEKSAVDSSVKVVFTVE